MRWTRWIAITSSFAAVAVAAVMVSCATPPAKPAAMTPQEKLARGEHLVVVLGCGDCHTPGSLYGAPDAHRLLSGSELGWTGPWGTSYARNITPDSTTGIGTWSADDIVKAIRVGQRPDGSPILPPMPWQDFANLTDDEAYAVAAYIKSVAPVAHKVSDRLRPGVRAPAALVFPPPPKWDAPLTPPAGAGSSAPH
ncbi:MAG: c-type cytochrome [Candidatus Eisenbacteria bacterium]|uniref:C-type cytochrome n=1 Tax=Eiseniibacteriota bacterium TaxID=2212470 RepID=A0A9D6LC84_UNCEI|nr:c-type cytochrome [Candidatus Eisenbacteria bacterium]MBI3540044.1 c-type cytochrome [Candidatus Eisenbacteria bacterium]